MKCASCQYVYYCNRECQKKAWLQHKIECPFLKSIIPKIVPDAARIMSRIILKLRNGGDLERGYYTDTHYRKFKDLMSRRIRFSNNYFLFHFNDNFCLDYNDIKNDKIRMEHFESLSHVLRDLLGNTYMPNEVELLGIYGRVCYIYLNISTKISIFL